MGAKGSSPRATRAWKRDIASTHGPDRILAMPMDDCLSDLRGASGQQITKGERTGLLCYLEGVQDAVAGHVPGLASPPIPSSVTAPPVAPERQPADGRTHLVIGDAHFELGQNLVRARWLGRMIRDLRPDVVVQIGDWYDLRSLSSYDRGKASAENRRYTDDVEAGHAAHDAMAQEAGDALLAAERIVTVGNHEQRADRFGNDNPAVYELVSSMAIYKHWQQRGWFVSPFLRPVCVDGVWYSHFHPSGPMGRPIGGVNAGRSLAIKLHASATAGHSHEYSHHAEAVGYDGRRIHGLSVGCFFEHAESYASTANSKWWRGIVLKRNVRFGDYDPERWGMDRIAREWGTEAERSG